MENSQYTIEKILVTPEMAAYWLTFNSPTNRDISPVYVKRLASAILRGQFEIGDSIKFESKGMLIDGQHRLSAIVLATIPTYLLVTRGYDPVSMSVLDIGMKRSVSNIATLAGTPLSNKQIAVTRTILLQHKDTTKYRVLTARDIISIGREFIEYINFGIDAIGGNLPSVSVVQGSIARAYFCGSDKDRLNEFGKICQGGVCTRTEDTAALRLREFLLSRRGLTRDRLDECLYTQAAIDCFLRYQPRTRLTKTNVNLFPVSLDNLFI
jgi:hypothetical protein